MLLVPTRTIITICSLTFLNRHLLTSNTYVLAQKLPLQSYWMSKKPMYLCITEFLLLPPATSYLWPPLCCIFSTRGHWSQLECGSHPKELVSTVFSTSKTWSFSVAQGLPLTEVRLSCSFPVRHLKELLRFSSLLEFRKSQLKSTSLFTWYWEILALCWQIQKQLLGSVIRLLYFVTNWVSPILLRVSCLHLEGFFLLFKNRNLCELILFNFSFDGVIMIIPLR